MHTVGDATSSVPAFLGKLWKLVEDPSTNHLISWNANGVSFTIRDQARFARELLPLYYKHNNMASFVRQLNMYGFHKVVSVDSGGLKLDKDEMEFAHMYFLQGQEFLLEHIKRKIPISKQEEAKHSKPEVLSRILADVRSMKGKQENVDSRLNTMKRENEALWREVASLRQKHMKQQQIVNKLIQFLISIVQPNGRAGLGLKRRYPLMLGGAVHPSSPTSDGKGIKNKAGGQQNNERLKDLKESDVSDIPTISILSSNRPIIHDVTDIDESSPAGLIEHPVETDGEQVDDIVEAAIDGSPLISEMLGTEISDIPIDIDSAENGEEVLDEGENLEEEINPEQPDFNTMVQMEAGTSSNGPGILERAMMTSPMSPDLLMAVDPREVNSGALLSVENNHKEQEGGRGKSVAKKQDKGSLQANDNSVLEREELDNHLDTMQVDLEQLREVLSLQGNPLDASTLLGVCDSLGLSFEPTLDSCNWTGYPSATWNWRGIPSESSPLLASLLEHQMLPKLFSADEALSSNSYFSVDMDMFKNTSQGNIVGNEVIAYNNSSLFDMVGDFGGQLNGDDSTRDIAEDSVDKDTSDLFDLLDDPISAPVSSALSPNKKRKKN